MKHFTIPLLCLCMTALTSCSQSIEERASVYAEQIAGAMISNNREVLDETSEEAISWLHSLTEEERTRAYRVIEEVEKKYKGLENRPVAGN